MPSYTIRATDKETGEVRLMKVKAGTPMTEVIKQYVRWKSRSPPRLPGLLRHSSPPRAL